MSLAQTPQSPVQGELHQAKLPPAPPAPSVHTRALITWLAIFPLVSIGMLALGPLMEGWNPVLRAFILTLLVVPAAVYVVVPRLFVVYGMLARRRAGRGARNQA